MVGLIVFILLPLAACGGQAASSVSQAVSSIAASHSVSASQGGGAAQPSTDQPTTAAPTSAEPTTTAPTRTLPTRTTTVVASTPAATPSPASGGSGFPWGWFWLAVGIAVAAGLVIWAVTAHRKRAGTATDWRGRVIDAYARGAALHDAMAAAETPGARTAADAGLRWADLQRRADDYGQLLYAMQQAAPGDQERILVTDVIASLQAARSAMDAERSSPAADGMLAGIAHDRISFFASSLNSLREPDVRPA